MQIKSAITKEIFESYVPVAKMPERNDSVYNRLVEQFVSVYGQLLKSVIGTSFESAVEDDDSLKTCVLRYVSLQSFAVTARHLDVVLTATGFGIVNTNTMAPASRARVDALIDDCRLRALENLHDIILHLIGVQDWGRTEQAASSVPCLFWHIDHMRKYTVLKRTADNWQDATGWALNADAVLRNTLSTEYMDELLLKTRTNALTNADSIIVDKCLRTIGDFVSNHEFTAKPSQFHLDAIVRQLETYIDFYPTYQNSDIYKGRHAEHYRNRKEDTSFFFM